MVNIINGVPYPDGVVIQTSTGDASNVDDAAIIAAAAAQAKPRGGQSITVTGNGHNVSAHGGHAGNGTR